MSTCSHGRTLAQGCERCMGEAMETVARNESPHDLCPHCGKANRFHILATIRGICEIKQAETRERARLAELSRTGKFLNAKSFGHMARGIDFNADYCDLRNGIVLSAPYPVRLDEVLRGTATTFGWHGVNIHGELNGFRGYDTVKIDISRLRIRELGLLSEAYRDHSTRCDVCPWCDEVRRILNIPTEE